MRWLKFIGRAVHYVINTLLALLLCGLIFLGIILLKEKEVPVPRQLVSLIDKAAAENGLKVEFGELQIDLRGIVYARDVKIYSIGNSDAIVEAEQLLVKISLLQALIGEATPTEIALSSGSFYTPAILSPSGKREQLIQDLHIKLTRKAQNWRVNTFLLETLGARVQVNGSFFTPLPGMEKHTTSDAPPDIMGIYVDSCRELLSLQEFFSRFEGCILEVELNNERNGPLLIEAEAFLDGYFDKDTKVKYGAASIHMNAELGVDGIFSPEGPGRVRVNSITWEDHVTTGFTEAHVLMNKGIKGFTEPPNHAELYSYNITAWGMPFDGAFATLDFNKFEQTGFVNGQIMLKSDRNWLAVQGLFDPLKESGHVTMRAQWDPMFLLMCTALPKDDIPTGIKVNGRPRWQASVDLEPGLKPSNSKIKVNFDSLSYDDIHLEAAVVEGNITEDELDLYSVALYAKDYQVSGNYYQRFSNGEYRFQSEGTVWPHILNPIIDEDWWTDLWAGVTFHGKPPHAAIDMSGQYGEDGAENRIYGSASLQDATYMDEPVKTAFTRIWQTPDTLDLFDFTMAIATGNAQINLHWDYLPNNEQKFLSFIGRTNVPLVTGAKFATEDAIPIAKMFPSQATPQLNLAGLVYGEHSEHPNDLYLKISALFPGKFEFEDIRFDNGSFICALTPLMIHVTNGQLGLAGGKAALETTIDRQANDQLYVKDANITLTDSKLYELYSAIPFLRVARAKQDALDKIKQAKSKSKPAQQKPFEERYAGNVNLTFNTHGQLPDLNSFVGKGNLELTGANLGQLHLLGYLSSFLYSIGLHLGTLNFNAADTDFTLARSNLYFPNGRITGSTGEIAVNGNFNFDSENLDFLLTVHPFGNVEMPIVSQMLYVLSPLANTLEVELDGTLTTPDYHISVQPLAIFTGQDKVKDKNADVISPDGQSAAEKDSQ